MTCHIIIVPWLLYYLVGVKKGQNFQQIACSFQAKKHGVTLDTFTTGDPDIGPHLFGTFRPSIIGPLLNQVMKFELEIVWVMF